MRKSKKADDIHDQSRWDLYYKFQDLVTHGSDDSIKRFLENFTSEDFLDMPIVFDLVSYQKIELLKFLHNHNIPLTYHEHNGSNALHASSGAGGSLRCVKFFVENGILDDIHKRSGMFGDTPLTLAICYGHVDIVSFFKKRYGINGVSLQDLDVILDRVISNQNRLTGQNFITPETKYGK